MEKINRIFQSLKIRFPVVRAEDDLTDPLEVMREECGQHHCSELQEIYDACNKRVNSKKKTSETCAEELLDFMHCVDHCAAKTIFTKLK